MNTAPKRPHISLPENLPGITGPMKAYPETAVALNALADALLVRETPSFPKANRELIASYVSYLNDCVFCSESHGAVADFHLQQPGFARALWSDIEKAPVSERLKAQLKIAAKVQKSGGAVTSEDVDQAKKLGVSDQDIHDTVLIAAAFCMFNRYVDGLATVAPPRGDKGYEMMGARLAQNGYGKFKL